MTPLSLREYAVRQRERYRQLTRRADKRALLDEIVAVTKLHRKAVIRLLRRAPRHGAGYPRGGRPRRYGPEVGRAAAVLWEAAGHIGAHRLQPFVPELLDRLAQCGELVVPPAVDKLVRQASAATLGRLLAPARAQRPARGLATTRTGSWLKGEIPIRTFAEWDDVQPGFLEIDLVAHCGSTTEGFYLCTLCAVDIATAWIELEAVWGKGQERVGAAIHRVRAQLPMPLLGLDSDNGSEFINHHLYAYCQRHAITFTRSRAWKKNDNAHVEQKNGALVRGLVGYDRFATKAAHAQLAAVYRVARLHINFFQPVQKLVSKTRVGARAVRRYDRAQTPWQRLCAANVLSPAQHAEWETVYQRLNPLQLRRDLDRALARLWALAVPDPRRAVRPVPHSHPCPRPRPRSRRPGRRCACRGACWG